MRPWYLLILLVPIEVISFLTRPISLSVRLFANMLAGHTMLAVFGGFRRRAGRGWRQSCPCCPSRPCC
jgi:F0F1-type ATP synthase membrane subunit a